MRHLFAIRSDHHQTVPLDCIAVACHPVDETDNSCVTVNPDVRVRTEKNGLAAVSRCRICHAVPNQCGRMRRSPSRGTDHEDHPIARGASLIVILLDRQRFGYPRVALFI